jgi:hypothetical protein
MQFDRLQKFVDSSDVRRTSLTSSPAIVKAKIRPTSLRWIYQHMIEEYARHNGHADLIRERIDGTVGD